MRMGWQEISPNICHLMLELYLRMGPLHSTFKGGGYIRGVVHDDVLMRAEEGVGPSLVHEWICNNNGILHA